MLQLQFLNISKPPVWLVEAKFVIGSSATANCVLAMPGLLPEHASLLISDEAVDLIPYSAAAHTAINGQLITGRVRLQHGDSLTLGSAQIAVIDPKLTRKPVAPVEELPPAWRLQATSVALAQREYPLSGTVVLGRAQDCDICLALAHLSRRHAKFTLSGKGLELEDLGSSNGTFVNGKKIQRVLLNNGDEVSFDSLRFKVIGPEEEGDKTSIRPAITHELLGQVTSLRASPLSHKVMPSHHFTPAINQPVKPEAAPSAGADWRPLVLGLVLTLGVFGGLVWFLLH